MISKILLCWPEITIWWCNDATSRECQKKARHVRIGSDLARRDNSITVGDTHHTFVKRPVAKFAECHAISDIVVFTPTPGDNMGGIHHGVSLRCNDAYTAQGAAVVVSAHDDSSKTLVTHGRLVNVLFYRFLHQRQVGPLKQIPEGIGSVGIDGDLFLQRCDCLI